MMTQRWFYRMLGEEFGPVESDALDALIEDGTLSDDDEVRLVSRTRWQSVAGYRRGEVPGDSAADVPLVNSPAAGNIPTLSSPSMSAVLEQPSLGNDAWYFDVFGHDFGPVSFEELLEAAERGQIGPDDQVRLGVQGKPRRAGSIGRLMTCMPFVSPAAGGSVHSIDPSALLKAAATATPAPLPATAPAAVQPAKVNSASVKSAAANPAALEDLWFAWINGKQYGPVPMARLGQWLSSGQLQPSHHIRPAVATDWVLLESMPDLLASLSPAPTAPITNVAPPPSTAATPTIPFITPVTPAARVTTAIPRTDPDRPVRSDNEPSVVPTESASTPSPAAWTPPPSRPTPVRLPPSRGRSSSGGGFSLSGLSLGGLLGSFKFDIRLVGVAVVALAVVGWMFLPESTAGDRKHLETLRGLLQEAREIRAKKEGISAWEAFSEKAKRLGEPIVKEYSKTASAKKPAKQYLLRVARYCLPDLIETGMVKPATREDELERNLTLAAKRLGVTP